MVAHAVEMAARLLGLELDLIPSQKSGDDYFIRLREAPYPYGFALHLARGYLAWDASITPDPESRPLLARMSEVIEQASVVSLEKVLSAAMDSNIRFRVNGTDVRQLSKEEEWLDFIIEGTMKVGKPSEMESEALTALIVDSLSIPTWFLDQMLTEGLSEYRGQAEGDVRSFFGNRYERSRVNRAVCLRHFGLRCRGCGELVEEKYGVLGKEVVHVHHIIPISKMGGSKEVNPLTDLIPLCPNCHNVVHREDPPVSIERLREQTKYTAD